MRFCRWELGFGRLAKAYFMPERMRWERMKREGLAPGFVGLVTNKSRGGRQEP